MVLVTGGTGLVGSHLLFELSKSQLKIRALYRTKETIENVKTVFSFYTDQVDDYFNRIEWLEADLEDLPKLETAFQGVTHVYHCAALISFDPNDYYKLRKTNVTGTANIVNLSVINAIEKLCYVSSIATLGFDPEKITEETTWNPEDSQSVYAMTKHEAEMEVWRGVQEGVPSVIVNPGVILGPGFFESGSGLLFKRIHKGLKHYTSGVSGYVDVKDVVKGMIYLLNSDYKNERYIMVAENISFLELTTLISKAFKRNPPQKAVSSLKLSMAWRLDWLTHKLTGKKRKLTKNLSKTLTKKSYYSSEKLLEADVSFKFEPISAVVSEVCQIFSKTV
ncbi:NAD-dependent epimerase/dehydratase family protein [Flavobacteriaceae bacterium]|jgi:dihydroflavonol-4-reductase|nr:NAD-dependent epimerase/dehydratase family protein [Flavobacteriaceae bacterium]MDA9028288.1 NAD-dependent epimerase/dehydratase family protein [Flavobacteriaceae bacterium]MDG1385271.1 NAD-dependent epimerase/dehydratase family protein [Flavobacteriaceae bacterium]